uniref:Integrase catalytic domain-containing protein n=1 Tax=Nicotiana tabacum TaxID=4097 RepID=A0A1S3XBI2_TOBAC|nr:PREDICTED: uncharacterized protein LOC107763226 [Nicotiana tabacum]
MVKEGIVLEHKVTAHGIEVDRAKVEVIARVPPPNSVKSIRSFLGHVGFYKRFIKNFSSITKPLTTLLVKDAKLFFNVECLRAFELIKEKLVSAPIMVTHNWSQPFEIMCDASDVVVGAVLGQRRDKMFRPIYYANRILNDAQVNNATTEKEWCDRRCVPEEEMISILSHFHDGAAGEHYGGNRTATKVMEAGFFWPTLYKYARAYVAACDKCQRAGNISKRDEVPLNSILVCGIFDVWGIDFMGQFPMSHSHEYILVAIDYVSKWVEAIPTRTNDARVVCEFLRKNIFTHFGTPRAIISDNGSHFVNKQFAALLSKLEQMNELEEFRLDAYESARIFKEKTKRWHDSLIKPKEFHEGDIVLLNPRASKSIEDARLSQGDDYN